MEEILKSIKNELSDAYINIDILVLEVLFSKGHISCTILINGNVSNVEISEQKMLKISEYVQQFIEGNNNRMIVTMIGNKVSENFDFSSEYYISSNQGILNDILTKRNDLVKITADELKSLLLIAKYAISKTNIKDLINKSCKLYLAIDSFQLVTDISPNMIRSSGKYLFLCNISTEDIGAANFENLLLQKIDQVYKR
jgi:predicted ATP-grasp superfamily ATP-dependent carboligase